MVLSAGIKELQHLHYGDRYFSVDFLRQDCAEIARSFGWHAIRVGSASALEPAVRDALTADGPSFVDVLSADQTVETPPVIAWQKAETAKKGLGLRKNKE